MSLSPNDSTLPNYDDPERIGSPAASLATSIILGTLAVTAVAARLWARLGVLHRAGLDDFFIVIALVSSRFLFMKKRKRWKKIERKLCSAEKNSVY